MTRPQLTHLYSYLRRCHADMVDACRQVGLIGLDEVVEPPTDEHLRNWVDNLQVRALDARHG